MGFPLEFCIGAGVSENWNDGAFRWWKKFSDRFSRFDTIPECDGHPATQPSSPPPSHVAVAITLNALAKASSLKMIKMRFWGFCPGGLCPDCPLTYGFWKTVILQQHYVMLKTHYVVCHQNTNTSRHFLTILFYFVHNIIVNLLQQNIHL